MTVIQAIILGIVQGITEFLPVSSSGHLVLTPHFLGWHIPDEQVFVFNVIIQLGTLVAVVLYFWQDLRGILVGFINALTKKTSTNTSEVKLGLNILVGTLPTVVIGLLFKNRIQAVFTDPKTTAYFLFLTAALLVAAEVFGKRTQTMDEIRWPKAIFIGFFQALALFPGVSRSGSTISGGMFGSLKRADAARFSFLLFVPAMIGAGILAVLDLFTVPNLGEFIGPLLIGFVVSGVVGYFAIRWLLNYLTKNPLYYFSIYLVIVASAALLT
ncbi:MAG TPA: undecaprenyl-diphosphatase UppP [Anaerolineales bacterium]|nr:undecaprenyl-diphosphatase UppP [Anaerolineales bacterium]